MLNDPNWWSEVHSNQWDRIKSALKRDWEQTKADFSNAGEELDQDAGDTVKQAMGKQAIPPANQPNPKESKDDDEGWAKVEPEYRYGVGAREHHGGDEAWSDRVESKLKEEWSDLKSGRTWDEAKNFVRRGWDRGHK